MELIVSIVKSGFAYKAMEVARRFGATGDTILHGRIAQNKDKKVFGITIHPEKDVLLIVGFKHDQDLIMKALNEKYGVKSEANGIVFSLTVSKAFGIRSNIRDLGEVVV